MELLQGLNDEEIDRKPDRAAPVRVAPEQPAVGFGRLVADVKIYAVVPVYVGRVLVDPGQCTHAVRGKELGLVQHSRQETLHAVSAEQGQQTPVTTAFLVPVRNQRGQFGAIGEDRKSTRLNSSHPSISYAVFCLKKKKPEDTSLA